MRGEGYRDWATCVVVAHQFNMEKHKIAIWVEDGVIQGIRSSVDISVEVIDVNFGGQMTKRAERKWETYQTEFPFSIY